VRAVQVRAGEEWVCIGTLYKNMALKPSVLVEYKDERGISAAILVPAGHFTSDDDSLLLEDDSGRMNLQNSSQTVPQNTPQEEQSEEQSAEQSVLPAMPVHALCTGLVVAVKGTVQPDGDLLVADWCAAGLPAQPHAPPVTLAKPLGQPLAQPLGSVLLVSGLLAGGSHDPFPTRLFLDHLAGYLGGEVRTETVYTYCMHIRINLDYCF
jgi:DNA polymerase delta subunit 2